jgi:hypothetical protein
MNQPVISGPVRTTFGAVRLGGVPATLTGLGQPTTRPRIGIRDAHFAETPAGRCSSAPTRSGRPGRGPGRTVTSTVKEIRHESQSAE